MIKVENPSRFTPLPYDARADPFLLFPAREALLWHFSRADPFLLSQPLNSTSMLTFFPGPFCDGCGALALNTSLALTNMRPILSMIFGGWDKLAGPRWTRLLQGLLLDVAIWPASSPTA